MTVIPFPKQRPLAQVLAELLLAEAELARLRDRPGNLDLTPEQDARWDALEDGIDRCKAEARALIEAATGVSWSAIESASL